MIIFAPNTIIKSADHNSNNAELGATFHGFTKCVNRKDIGNNVAITDQEVQHGWGFILGNAAYTMQFTVNLPVPFDDTNYDVSASLLGYKTGSDPTSRTDFGLQGKEFVSGVIIVSSSQFKVTLHCSDDTTFSTTTRFGISWVAVGTRAR